MSIIAILLGIQKKMRYKLDFNKLIGREENKVILVSLCISRAGYFQLLVNTKPQVSS